MEKAATIQPKLSILSDPQKEKINSDSQKILSSIGVRVDSLRARKVFASTISTKSIDGDLVRIPFEVVEEAIKKASSSMDIFNRKGELAFHLPGETRFGIGVTTLNYQDPETDKIAPFTRRHMETSVRLGERLSNFDVISTMGVIQNVPVEDTDLYAALEMTANTIKPLVMLVSDESAFPAVLDLLESLHGDLASKPFIIPYFNPITPLVIDSASTNKMFATIDRGLPFIFASAGMTGGTTPIASAGALTLMNAELLAGLVLSQLIKEGTPIMLGCVPNFFDMKGGGIVTDPMRFLMNLVCAEMMDYYNIPHLGTAGAITGMGADLIAGGYQWLNHITSCIGKVGLAPFVGAIFDGMVFSPKLVIYANEVIEQARLFARGFVLDDSSIGLDEIVEVGPGGNFLTSDSTLRLFRDGYYSSDIFPCFAIEKWEEKDCPSSDEFLRNYTKELIDDLAAPWDHGDLLERGEVFISKFRK